MVTLKGDMGEKPSPDYRGNIFLLLRLFQSDAYFPKYSSYITAKKQTYFSLQIVLNFFNKCKPNLKLSYCVSCFHTNHHTRICAQVKHRLYSYLPLCYLSLVHSQSFHHLYIRFSTVTIRVQPN